MTRALTPSEKILGPRPGLTLVIEKETGRRNLGRRALPAYHHPRL